MLGGRLILLGLLLPIAFGRWGSYVGVPGTPIYLADVLVMVGLLVWCVDRAGRHSKGEKDATTGRRAPTVLKVAAAIFGAVIVIGLSRAGELSLLAIRDALPFVYLALVAVLWSPIQAVGRDTVGRWVRNAAVVHTAWFAPAQLGVLPTINVPFAGVPVFTTRGDFDVLICGLAVVVVAVDGGCRRWVAVLISALAIAAALSSGSRAGLLSAGIVVLVVVLIQRPFNDREAGLRRFGFAALAVAPITLITLFVLTDPPEWTVGLRKLIPSDTTTFASGQNTWGARVDAWILVIQYGMRDAGSAWLGNGFGSDTIQSSGAIGYLSGDPSVRAAHNFLVTWFASVGIVGTALVLVALGLLLLCAARTARAGGINGIGFGLSIGLMAAGVAGVILESPFGYMSFAFAIVVAGLADETAATVSPMDAPTPGSTQTPSGRKLLQGRSGLASARMPNWSAFPVRQETISGDSTQL